MATKLAHRIRYNNGMIIVRPTRGEIQISHHQQNDPNDPCRVYPVLTKEQQARVEALGARLRMDYYVLPIDKADEVLAIAHDVWGEPVDADGYTMTATDEPAAEAETELEPQTQTQSTPETATENNPTQAAARIIHEHAGILYHALHEYIRAQYRNPGHSPEAVAAVVEENEELYLLADRILDVSELLTEPELWTIQGVAEYLEASSTGSARKTLSRWGVKPVSREAGQWGQSLYDADRVRAAKAARPGRGARTDLRDSAEA